MDKSTYTHMCICVSMHTPAHTQMEDKRWEISMTVKSDIDHLQFSPDLNAHQQLCSTLIHLYHILKIILVSEYTSAIR